MSGNNDEEATSGMWTSLDSTGADGDLDSFLAVEVADLPTIPEWLRVRVQRAEAAAMKGTTPRLAAVVLREQAGRRVDDLVVLRGPEFRAWYRWTVGGYRGDGDYPEYE